MTQKISRRDWETLSAYIDNELSKRARSRLEKRLDSEPALRIALRKLQRTQKTLRQAPHLHAPRNFTLTPAMIGQVRKSRRIPRFRFFQLATVVASLFLVAVLVLDFGSGFLQPELAMAPAPLKEESVEAPRASEGDAQTEPEMEIMNAEEYEEDSIASTPIAKTALPPEEPQEEALTLEDAEESELEKSAETVGTEATDTDEPTPTSTTLKPTPTLETPSLTPKPSITPSPYPLPTSPPLSHPTYRPFLSSTIFRLVEVILALIVLGFGTAAWTARRKRKKNR